MKFFIIAGEASGDLHGSHLVRELKLEHENSEFEGWGGDLMIAEGVKVHKHIRDLAFMGFVEVVQNINTIKKNFALCKKQIKEYQPDAVIFVDYPGFNLRMAKWVKNNGFKSIYFISPNVWAWKANRVYKVRDYTDRMYVILPFEQEFYAKYGIEVEFQGHPLVDAVNNHPRIPFEEFCKQNNLSGKPIIALMAGSRKQEIKHMLPIMSEVADEFPDYEFVITGSPSVSEDYYQPYIKSGNVRLIFGKTYDILSHSTAGLIKSGTATLEAALFGVPQVVCYKGGAVSVAIAKMVADVKYISLVNLILDAPAVKELIQKDLNKIKIIEELKNILPSGEKIDAVKKNYLSLFHELNTPGIYHRIAESIIKRI